MSAARWLDPTMTLEGSYVRLEPMLVSHEDDLNLAAYDGELWNLNVTSVPHSSAMKPYILDAIKAREEGAQLPFVVRRLSDGEIVGATRYYDIRPKHRNLAIGYTWYSKSAQRTAINSECKFLLLKHAFEYLNCISVVWHTHHNNFNSQNAIERLGAKKDGLLRNDQIMPDGSIRNTVCYSLLNAEWPETEKMLTGRLYSNKYSAN